MIIHPIRTKINKGCFPYFFLSTIKGGTRGGGYRGNVDMQGTVYQPKYKTIRDNYRVPHKERKRNRRIESERSENSANSTIINKTSDVRGAESRAGGNILKYSSKELVTPRPANV